MKNFKQNLTSNQKCGSRSWKRLIFRGSGSTLMKEVGSGSKLGSESVEEELEAEAIFSKSGASAFQTGYKRVTIIIII